MAIEKIELSEALQNLATQNNIDKVTGVYNGVPANIAKADLASVVAGVMRGVIIEVVVPKDTTITLDKMSGFFALDCITGSGYNEFPIVGYASSRNNTLLLGGYYDNASFNSSGALTIRGTSSTELRYKGILFGNKQN